MRYTQPAQPLTDNFDFVKAAVDLAERFARNIWLLGHINTKGTYRYTFEVDYMYLLDELQRGPLYSRGKRYEQLNALLNSMINYGKLQRGKTAPVAPVEAAPA